MGAFAGPEIAESGLVLALDAGNLKSYPGSGTTWTDLSGGGNTGTLTNGPTYSSANGGSLVFDGTNDYISLSSSNNYNFGTSNFSIEIWFNITGNTPLNGNNEREAALFHIGSDGGFTTNLVLLIAGNFTTTGTGIQFYQNSPVETDITSVITVSQNTWHHIVIVKSNNNIIKYFNNSQILQIANTTSWGSSSNIAKIGQLWSGSNFVNNLNGRVSNLKIYNRALSATEVSQNFIATRSRFSI
jgi:hypothetical protein